MGEKAQMSFIGVNDEEREEKASVHGNYWHILSNHEIMHDNSQESKATIAARMRRKKCLVEKKYHYIQSQLS